MSEFQTRGGGKVFLEKSEDGLANVLMIVGVSDPIGMNWTEVMLDRWVAVRIGQDLMSKTLIPADKISIFQCRYKPETGYLNAECLEHQATSRWAESYGPHRPCNKVDPWLITRE